MGGWAVMVVGLGGWGGGVERDYKVRHHLNLCLTTQTEMKMKKMVGAISFFHFLFFFNVLLPSRSSNGQLQRHERDKQINTWGETPTNTYRIHRITNRRNEPEALALGTACRLRRAGGEKATGEGGRRITVATADSWHVNTQMSWLREKDLCGGGGFPLKLGKTICEGL